MDEVQVAAVALILAVAIKKKKAKSKQRRARRFWTKPWLLRREQHSLHTNLVQELRVEDQELHANYLRMSRENFDELLAYIDDDIRKKDTIMRDSLSPSLKLTITLRYLATGASFADLGYQYRVHNSTISQFIPEVCRAIYCRLKGQYLRVGTHIYLFLAKSVWNTTA